MRICAISDLHGFLPVIEEPAELLLIAGDISPLNLQRNKIEMEEWIFTTFVEWIRSIPVQKVVLVAGNHDYFFQGISQTKKGQLELATGFKLVYLKHRSYEYYNGEEKVSIFGTPYCHMFGNWPFMLDDISLEYKFADIPDKVDIIITHDPPYLINDCDVILDSFDRPHCGSKPLANRLKDVDYKLLVCGHIHSGNHILNDKVVNVSYLSENYCPNYEPFYYDLQC